MPGGGMPAISNNTRLKLLSVPFAARLWLGEYIFINGGGMFDFDMNFNKQVGLGALCGIGAKYDINSDVSIFINPYIKAHTLVPFFPDREKNDIIEKGIKLGVMFSL